RRARESSAWRLHVRKLSVLPEPETVYREIFASNEHSFWFDSSAVIDGFSRFSFMGDGSGPLAEYVTYSTMDGIVSVRRAQGGTERIATQFFAYLDEQLQRRAIPAPAELPFAFNLGYVGYLGYELKAETCGQAVHQADAPDAALLFADRALALDHVDGSCYLLALSTGMAAGD